VSLGVEVTSVLVVALPARQHQLVAAEGLWRGMLDAQLTGLELVHGEHDVKAERAEVPVFVGREGILEPALTGCHTQGASARTKPFDVFPPRHATYVDDQQDVGQARLELR